MFLDNMVDG
ncbi:hypothetical protein CEXT_215571, partial [Caerostris extrusa]